MESWRRRLLPPPPPPAAAHISTPLPMCIPCLPICLIGVCLSFRETTDGYMWSSGGISFVARDLLLAWVLKQLHERRQRPSTSFDFPSFTLLPSCLATTTTTTTGWTPPPFRLPGCRPMCRTLLDPLAWKPILNLCPRHDGSHFLCTMSIMLQFKKKCNSNFI